MQMLARGGSLPTAHLLGGGRSVKLDCPELSVHEVEPFVNWTPGTRKQITQVGQRNCSLHGFTVMTLQCGISCEVS